jgi:O-antigen/teichoic acid export membrane protein
MSTFRAAFRGTSWAVVSQVVTGLGQLAYSALTARIFRPQAFGEYAAALSLTGLIALASTGLASFILKEPELKRSQVRAINSAAVAMALLGAGLFWLISPVWLGWLNSPAGSEFVPLLTFATFASPVAAVQWALLKREGDGRADAGVFVLAFIGATGIGAVCAILIREPWTLALGTAVTPIILAALSWVLRRAVYPVEHSRLAFDWVRFTLRVFTQNSVFYGLRQVPTWSVGATAGAAMLGEFSRGNVITNLPASALTKALTNGTAPHWRKIESKESRVRAVSEALTLGASITFVSFAALAALAQPLIAIWLGPGWDLAAEFAAWLAIGYAMQVPMAQLGNFLELAGDLSRIRWIQLANAAGLALGVALLVWLHDFRFLLAGFALSELLGLLVAVFQVSAALEIPPWQLLKQLVAPLVSAIGVASVAYMVAHLVATGPGEGTSLGSAVQLLSGAFAVIALVFVTRKWQPAFAILVARGVLRRGPGL